MSGPAHDDTLPPSECPCLDCEIETGRVPTVRLVRELEPARTDVTGCATCPFMYLHNDCKPSCTLDDSLDAGVEDRHYVARDDAPPECPLRAGPRLVVLKAGA